jgi:hypothetical protein
VHVQLLTLFFLEHQSRAWLPGSVAGWQLATRPTDLSSNKIRVGLGKPFDWYGSVFLKYHVSCPCPIQPETDDGGFAVLALGETSSDAESTMTSSLHFQRDF